VHDALLIQAPLERLDEDIFRMRAHMEQASRIVLGGFTVRTDVVIVKHPDPYMDERGAEFWDTVMSLSDEEEKAKSTTNQKSRRFSNAAGVS
jgi:DNA polymerase I